MRHVDRLCASHVSGNVVREHSGAVSMVGCLSPSPCICCSSSHVVSSASYPSHNSLTISRRIGRTWYAPLSIRSGATHQDDRRGPAWQLKPPVPGRDPEYTAPPPAYPPIVGRNALENGVSNNLMQSFVDMSMPGKNSEADLMGAVLSNVEFWEWGMPDNGEAFQSH
jgi:hypothetical protein